MRGWAGASGAELEMRRKGGFSLGPWEDSLEAVSGMEVWTLRPRRWARPGCRGSEARIVLGGELQLGGTFPSRGPGPEGLWLRRSGENRLLIQQLGAPGCAKKRWVQTECDVGAHGAKHSPHLPRLLGQCKGVEVLG